MTKAWTASEIVEQLAAHHAADLFVAECKNGSTWSANHLRLDAWVLRRTWSPLTTVGYEVKVSRADYERDQKWPQYLPLCHQLSFVCPAGLLKAVDLPPGVGLVWVSATGRLHTKVKAARHEPDPQRLVTLLCYVLMARSVIVADMHEANAKRLPETKDERLAAFRRLVEHATLRHDLAEFVNAHVREQFARMEERTKAAERQGEQTKMLIAHLAKRGIVWNPENYAAWRVVQDIDKLLGVIDLQRLSDRLAIVQRAAEAVSGEIENLRRAADRKGDRDGSKTWFCAA